MVPIHHERHGSRRSAPLDVARALAVIGVVVNHAVDGLVASGNLPRTSVVSTVNDALYLFRIPALALLLGVFIPGAVAKKGTPAHLRHRVLLVVYLYVVWRLLQGSVEVAASGVKNHATDPTDLVRLWVTDGQLWFLPFLAVATVVVALARPWASAPRRIGLLVGLGVLTVCTWARNPAIVGVVGLSVVLFTGIGASADLAWWSRRMRAPLAGWLWIGAAAAAGFVLLFRSRRLVPSTLHHPVGFAVVLLSALAAGLGVVALLAVAVVLSRWGVAARFLTVVGRKTLPVFLAHVIVVAGLRVVLARGLHVHGWAVLLVTEVVLGVVVPLGLASVASRTVWLGWLFELPRWIPRGPGTVSGVAEHPREVRAAAAPPSSGPR